MRFLHDARNLVVDAASGGVGVILRVAVVATQEHLVVGLAEYLNAQVGAHAVVGNHGAGHLGGAFQVVRGARGDVLAEQLFGNTATHEHGQLVAHLVAAVQHLVLVGDGKGVAQRAATADDRDLMHRIGTFQKVADQGVAAFVVGDGGAGALVQHTALALGTGDDALHGILHLGVGDDVFVATRREDGRLVEQVCQVRTGEARGELGDAGKIHVVGQRLVLGMDPQDLLAALHVGGIDHDLAVEAAGAQQCRVKDVCAVGCRDEHHGIVCLKAVHFHQQLVQGLLALVVATAQAGTTLTANGVDLVDEDDGRASFLGLLEQVAHAGSAYAHEHLHEVGAGNAEERHARLAGYSAGKQGFTGARRAHQKAAARDLRAERLVLGRVLQEVLDLLHFLYCLVYAGNVGEVHIGMLFNVLLHLRLAERHLRVVGLVHLAEEEQQQARDDEDGQHAGQDGAPRRGQAHAVLNAGVLAHELAQRIGAHPCAGVVVLRAQLGNRELLRFHDGGTGAVRALGADAGVQGVERLVEGIGRGRACGGGRVVGAADHVRPGVVHGGVHAALLDGLHEFRGFQFIGLRSAGCCRHGAHHHDHEENADRDEHHQGDDVRAIRLPHRVLVVGRLCHTGRSLCVRSSWLLFGSDLGLQHADARKVAVALLVIEAIAHDELIGALEADVLAVDVRLVGRVLAQKRGNLDGCGLARFEVLHQVAKRKAAVQDVLGDEHMPALNLAGKVLQDADHARAFHAVAVRRDGHVVHFNRKMDLAHQVGHEDGGTAQYGDNHDALACVVFGDLSTEFGYARADVFLGE